MGIIWQASASGRELSESSTVIEIAAIKIFGASQVRFSGIGSQPEGRFDRRFG